MGNQKLPRLFPNDVIRALERVGFFVHHIKGSHHYLIHPDRPTHRVVIPYHNKELKKGTLRGIIKQAGFTLEEFLKLL